MSRVNEFVYRDLTPTRNNLSEAGKAFLVGGLLAFLFCAFLCVVTVIPILQLIGCPDTASSLLDQGEDAHNAAYNNGGSGSSVSSAGHDSPGCGTRIWAVGILELVLAAVFSLVAASAAGICNYWRNSPALFSIGESAGENCQSTQGYGSMNSLNG